MRALIGVELLRKLPPGPCDIRDTKLPGFVLRVRPTGQHTYFANYARRKWQRVGTTKTHSVVQAREDARQMLADVVKGADPVAERQARQATITLATFIDEHYEPWALANRKSGVEQTATLRSIFKDLLGKPLTDISGFDVERWRSARLQAGVTPQTVNRNLNTLRGAFSRAVEWNLLATHPLSKVKASKTDRRGIVRYLSADEETRLRAALAARDETRRAERLRANAWRRERSYPEWPAYGTYTDHLTPMVMAGVDLNTVRELLGHADITMVLRYAHLAPEHKAAAVAKLVAL